MQRHSLRDLMQATDGRLRDVPNADRQFERVSIDSRDVRGGDVFWALKGENHDGHDFAAQAFQNDACLCVVSAARAESISGPKLIVDETRAALGRFACWHRDSIDALVIGVTGSVGKTTTRELIHAALSSHFQGIQSRKNFNNLVGLPLSLLDMQPQHEFAVFEMGASSLGDIRELCDLAQPEIGVITAIGPAHLRTFGSVPAIIQTKGELLEQLPSTGFAVLPGDDHVLRQMADRAPCPVIFVGQGDDNQIRASRVEMMPGQLHFHCEGDNFHVPVTGRHCLSNILCAIAIGLELGIPTDRLVEGLGSFQPVRGRCDLQQIGPWTVVDDTYNASPLAVQAACTLLQELAVSGTGQSLLILGDMRELGEIAAAEHQKIGQLAGQLQLDRILAYGDHADDVARGAKLSGMRPHQIATANNIDTLLMVLDCWLRPGDVVLVKGSRATRMECVIEWFKERAIGEPAQAEWNRFCA